MVNSYTLIFGGFLLLGGRAGDLIGRKRVFLVGVVVLTTASFLPGAVTVTAGLIALVYGIVNVQKAGWTSGTTMLWGAAALVLLTAFVVIERRQRAPLVRLGIVTVRTVRAANVTMLLVASGLFAMFFFNTLYAQQVLGFSPLQAGLAFLPVTAGIGIGAGLSQPGVKRLGIRTTSIIGMTLATVGMLPFAHHGRERDVPDRPATWSDPDLDRNGPDLRSCDWRRAASSR